MRKLIITILVCTFVFGMAGPAKAALFTETFLGSATDSVTANKMQSYTFLFDLTAMGSAVNYYYQRKSPSVHLGAPQPDAGGFDPSVYQLSGATLTYILSGGGIGNAVLNLGSDNKNLAQYAVPVAGQTGTYAYTFTESDLGYLAAQGGKFSIDFSYSATTKSATLEKLSMDVTAASVPIPGAAWLLGTGLIGMFAIRRRTRPA